jgi:hypothetical protein
MKRWRLSCAARATLPVPNREQHDMHYHGLSHIYTLYPKKQQCVLVQFLR